MNRRELLRRATAGLTAAGVSGVTVHALDAPVDPSSTLVILTTPGAISSASAERIQAAWATGMKGTRWEGVRCMVLGDGMQAQVFQR